MSPSLAERFARDKGAPQQVGDDTVHGVYRRQVSAGTAIVVTLAAGRADPVQGLCLTLKGGKLQVGDSVASDIVLWADTAPPTTTVKILRVKGAAGELCVWNCWRGRHGSTDAWLGDAGMVVVENAANVELHCSDGHPSFVKTDLVARLRFEDVGESADE